jgi:hypothetical protein
VQDLVAANVCAGVGVGGRRPAPTDDAENPHLRYSGKRPSTLMLFELPDPATRQDRMPHEPRYAGPFGT